MDIGPITHTRMHGVCLQEELHKDCAGCDANSTIVVSDRQSHDFNSCNL